MRDGPDSHHQHGGGGHHRGGHCGDGREPLPSDVCVSSLSLPLPPSTVPCGNRFECFPPPPRADAAFPLLCFEGVEATGGTAAPPALRAAAGADTVCVAATLRCTVVEGGGAAAGAPLPTPRCPPGVPAGSLVRAFFSARGSVLREALAAAGPAAALAAAHTRVCSASACNAPGGGDACVPAGTPRFAGGAPAAAAVALTALGTPLAEGIAPPPAAGVCVPFAALLQRAGELPPPAAADLACAVEQPFNSYALKGLGDRPGSALPGARYCVAVRMLFSEKEGRVVFRDGVSPGQLLRAADKDRIKSSVGGGSVWVCAADACTDGPLVDACIGDAGT